MAGHLAWVANCILYLKEMLPNYGPSTLALIMSLFIAVSDSREGQGQRGQPPHESLRYGRRRSKQPPLAAPTSRFPDGAAGDTLARLNYILPRCFIYVPPTSIILFQLGLWLKINSWTFKSVTVRFIPSFLSQSWHLTINVRRNWSINEVKNPDNPLFHQDYIRSIRY